MIPFVLGKDVSRIEELFQMNLVNGYWRNGPVLNNAISGIDEALWDIKGKMANMPVYDLLGGKSREGRGYLRSCGWARPAGSAGQCAQIPGAGLQLYPRPDGRIRRQGAGNSQTGRRAGRGLFRSSGLHPQYAEDDRVCAQAGGDEVELLHDVHERLSPIDTVKFAKDVEQFNLFFLEDSLAPEDIDWFRQIRQLCATPIAMGELFNNPA